MTTAPTMFADTYEVQPDGRRRMTLTLLGDPANDDQYHLVGQRVALIRADEYQRLRDLEAKVLALRARDADWEDEMVYPSAEWLEAYTALIDG